MGLVEEGDLLWSPSEERIAAANLTKFAEFATERAGRRFTNYESLWKWSTEDLEGFWSAIWDYFEIDASPYSAVLAGEGIENVSWFVGSELNFAEHIVRHATSEQPAIVFGSERVEMREVSWDELLEAVASLRAYLISVGVVRGDRVVNYMPNIPETLAAFLAAASLGAIWSSCSPDFGSRSVIDRFTQIEPKVLFAVDGYQYGGTAFDRRAHVAGLQEALPSLEATVLLPYLDAAADTAGLTRTVLWSDAAAMPSGPLEFERVPFDHPLWVVYTSGTTGLPKPIVHGHGGVLVEQYKLSTFHFDQRPGDRFFWFSSTGWIMWNLVISTLLSGATIAMYDGNVAHPDMWAMWDFAERAKLTFMGVSAAYVIANMGTDIDPSSRHSYAELKTIGSTGSPLPPDGFAWLYDHVKRDLWVTSASGGTDIVTGFVGGVPTLPVHAGEIQCRCLGVKAEAFDANGVGQIGQVGELVVTAPMPSMPVFLWGDDDGSRYHDSYFAYFPGVWHHGDWIKITERGSAVITGRSDSTINRKGVRIGTAEMYSAVESLAQIADSLVVDVGEDHNSALLVLFVAMAPGHSFDTDADQAIRRHIRESLSPRHVPDRIFAVAEVPRTLNGKKLEVPIKRILQGWEHDKAISLDSMANPNSVEFFIELATRLREDV